MFVLLPICYLFKMRFCANLNFLFCENNVGILDKFRLAQKSGFKGVEISFPADDALEKLVPTQQECQLDTVLINICLSMCWCLNLFIVVIENMFTEGSEAVKFGSTSIPGEEDQFKSNLKETVDLAKKMNCSK